MKKQVFLLSILFLVLCITLPVFAEEISGVIGTSDWINDGYTLEAYDSGIYPSMTSDLHYMKFDRIEYISGIQTFVRDDRPLYGKCTFDADAPHSKSVPYVAHKDTIAGDVLFTGSIGYVRSYDILGTETLGYQWMTIYNFANGTANLTGDVTAYLDFTGLYNVTTHGALRDIYEPGDGRASFKIDGYNLYASGDFSVTRHYEFYNNYNATSPSGIGTEGEIRKTIGGTNYPSRVLIYNATDNTIITSEPTTSSTDFDFNILATPIYISIISNKPETFNSSVLFGPTPTPTTTPTPTPTGPPSGYTRTTVFAQDGNTGGKITGATLNIKDVENSTWINATSTTSGTIVDVLNGHTLDIYGSYPGYYTASQELGAIPGGNYNLPLYPPSTPAGTGKVNLMVAVYDSTTGLSLSGVSVHEQESGTGKSDTQNTGVAGTVTFRVTNATAITVTATRSGYGTTTKGITVGDFADSFLSVSMDRLATATPTTYIPPTAPIIPTVSGTPGAGGNYTGFWGPFANGLEGAGALPSEIGILLATMLIFVGFCVGGWSGAAYSPAAPFNGIASMVGGVFGFVLSCAFGFIPLIWVIAVVMIGVFLFIFFPKG